MTLAAVTERLRADDPVRLAMAMLAPQAARPRLVTLYALNAELARTALSAREPLVAGMRVQWWTDRLRAMADGPPPPNELLTPLWEAWGPDAARLAPLAEARLHDAAREPHASPAEVEAYAAATGGALMGHAAWASGCADDAVRAQGTGAAIAAWLRARPALQPLGLGLALPDPPALAALAARARLHLATAAAARRRIPGSVAPVLFAGIGAGAALAAAAAGRDPAPVSDFARRAALARLALTGRWWF